MKLALHTYIIIFLFLLLPAVVAAGTPSAKAEDSAHVVHDGDKVIYTVQYGDRLFTIAQKFGSSHFWEAIYIMNADKIKNPHYIYPGQKIVIPYFVANFFEYGFPIKDVLHQPFCTTGEIEEINWDNVDYAYLYFYDQNEMATLSAMARADMREKEDGEHLAGKAEKSDEQVDEETMMAFREAFEALVRQEQEERRQEEEQAASERQMFVEVDGMIHDETRSKIGRDFYDIFYARWQSPPDASNYSIRITEQPAPNLGTIIAVQVNNTETFRGRLQPRHDAIEEASQFAVRRTYMFLQQNQQQFMIY